MSTVGRGMKRSPLRKMSKKMVRHNLEYQRAKRKYLEEHPMCEKCGYGRDVTLHHKAGRGSRLSNPKYFSSLCALCHAWCHRFPKMARDMGYMLDKFNPENKTTNLWK